MRSTLHVAIAWAGLPYYAARVIREARELLPSHKFTVIANRDGVPYRDIEKVVGQEVIWIDDSKCASWEGLGVAVPDLFVTTSWSHRAFMDLARSAKREKKAVIISMVDNYFIGSPKQLAGALYFRMRLRWLFDYMWVPGIRSVSFMRFLGMPRRRVMTGLYSADHDLFYPPEVTAARRGVVFVGQLIARKGVDAIISAAKKETALVKGVNLELFGNGELIEKIQECGLTVRGFVQPSELGAVYRRSRALLLPSKMDHWGVVVHEAAACGCMLLVTKQSAAAADLIEHGINGYVMNSSTDSEVINALRWLETRNPKQFDEGVRVSIRKASAITPAKWAENLGVLVMKRARSSRNGLGE